MRVFNQHKALNFTVDVPNYAHVDESLVYVPLACYTNLDTNERHYYLYLGESYTKHDFEINLKRIVGDTVVLKNSQLDFVDWTSFASVNNYMYCVSEGMDSLQLLARYDDASNTLSVGPREYVEECAGFDILCVYERGYSRLSSSKTLIAYSGETGLNFRRAFEGEVVWNYHYPRILATRLYLSNGIKLEFLVALRGCKSYEELCSAIEKAYELDSTCYRLQVSSMPIVYASEDIESIHNFGRVEKYHAIVDLETGGVHLRTFRDLNPLFTQIKPEIPAISQKHRLYPVYEF